MVPTLRIPDSTTLGTREPTYTDDDEGECEAPRSGKENNLEDNGRDRCRPVPRSKRPRPRDGTVDDSDYGNDVYSSSLSEVECIGLAKSSSTVLHPRPPPRGGNAPLLLRGPRRRRRPRRGGGGRRRRGGYGRKSSSHMRPPSMTGGAGGRYGGETSISRGQAWSARERGIRCFLECREWIDPVLIG